jgi:hypothetical protein
MTVRSSAPRFAAWSGGPEVRPAATDQSCGDLVGPEIRGVIDPNDRHAAGCVIGPEFTPQH